MKILFFGLLMLFSMPIYGQTVVPIQLPPITVPASSITVPARTVTVPLATVSVPPASITIPPFDITVPAYDDTAMNARVVKLETALNRIQTAINQLQTELGTIFAAFSARPDEYEMAIQQDTLTVDAPGVLANDTFVDPIKIEVVRQPSNGVVTVNNDGSLVYTPDRSQLPTGTSQISFDYKISPKEPIVANAGILPKEPTPSAPVEVK